MNEIVLVPWPVMLVAPPGKVHVYVSTPGCSGTLYVAAVPFGAMNSHTLVGPLIGLGVLGVARVTVMLLIPLTPHSFTACTVIALVVKPTGNSTDTVLPSGPGPAGVMTTPACAVQM